MLMYKRDEDYLILRGTTLLDEKFIRFARHINAPSL